MSKMVLFANCFPVKGHQRSTICDTGRFRYDFIPNTLYDLLIRYNKTDLKEVVAKLSASDLEVFQSYIDFLVEKEYVFFTDEPEMFPDIDLSWERSAMITNCVIDYITSSDHDFPKIINELSDLGCEALEIRSFEYLGLTIVNEWVSILEDCSLRSVNLLLKYGEGYNAEFFKALLKKNQRIISVVIHSAPHELLMTENDGSNLFFINNKIESEAHCGAISKFNFSSNISMFLESKNYNNCLNKKIAIDKFGNIRNCPSMPESFGHHHNVELKSVAELDGFKKLWPLSKDHISICSDCEFRYVCTDCRAYTQDASVNNAKPIKCTYDPYHAKWVE